MQQDPIAVILVYSACNSVDYSCRNVPGVFNLGCDSKLGRARGTEKGTYKELSGVVLW